eukprot:jgi/Mesvir1/19124/Mv12866-RA.1
METCAAALSCHHHHHVARSKGSGAFGRDVALPLNATRDVGSRVVKPRPACRKSLHYPQNLISACLQSHDEQPLVVGLGELLWDIFPDTRKPGGAPANVMFHVMQQGGQGVLCSRVGNDPLGSEILQYLREQGMDTSFVQVDERCPTGTVTVKLENGQPSYTIDPHVAWDHIEYTDAVKEVVKKADAICFGTLAQRCAVSRASIQTALQDAKKSCIVVYDCNLRQDFFNKNLVSRCLLLSHVLKLNDSEIPMVARVLGIKSSEPSKFAHALFEDYGIDLVVVTRGARGCLIISPHESYDIPGVKVQLADAVGAGDAFTSALIMALVRKWPLELAGRYANEVGALVASHYGAMPPLKDKFAELRARLAPEFA